MFSEYNCNEVNELPGTRNREGMSSWKPTANSSLSMPTRWERYGGTRFATLKITTVGQGGSLACYDLETYPYSAWPPCAFGVGVPGIFQQRAIMSDKQSDDKAQPGHRDRQAQQPFPVGH